MKNFVSALFITITFIANSFACDCGYEGSFLKVFNHNSFVAKIKVVEFLTYDDTNGEQIPMSMKVEIIEIYRGKKKESQ